MQVLDLPFVSVQYELVADAEPGLLTRLLQPLARRDLVPDRVRTTRRGDLMEATIAVENVPSADAHLVEGNLRQVVGVRHLTVVLRGALRAVA